MKYHDSGGVELISAVIRQAISDFQNSRYKQLHKLSWQEAEAFLFEAGWLEEYLEKFHLEDRLNCSVLRHWAKTVTLVEWRGNQYADGGEE